MTAGEEVIIEVPREGLRDAGGFAEQMRREAVQASELRHPNIAQTAETGIDDGVPYAVSPDVNGVELTPLVEGLGGLSLSRAAGIIAQVASALAAAHAASLVHGTLEPSRVLVTHRDGVDHVTLTGFGFTPPPGSDGDANRPFGVPAADFASPEQIRGHQPTASSDVYALGCLLYHALLAFGPAAGADDAAKLEAHLHGSPALLTERAPELPEALDAVIGRALAKDPAQRYGSADDLAAAVMEIAGERAPGSTVSAQKQDTAQKWEQSIAEGAHQWSPSKPVIQWPQAGSDEVAAATPPASAAATQGHDPAAAAPEWPQPHLADTPPSDGGDHAGPTSGVSAGKRAARALAGLAAIAAVAGLVALVVFKDDNPASSGDKSSQPAKPRPAAPAPAPSSPTGALIAWPRRDAYTVVVYVASGNRAQARARARQAAKLGFRAGVLNSSDYPNLPPNRVVGFAGVYDSRGQAQRAVARLRREGVAKAPYVRRIKGAGA